jgi:hypothetical protein
MTRTLKAKALQQTRSNAFSIAIAASLLFFQAPALAQTAQTQPSANTDANAKSDLLQPPTINETLSKPGAQPLLGGSSQAEQKGVDGCLEVEINGQRSYDCTNRKLEEKAKSIPGQGNIPPVNAQSNDVKLGIQNETAIRQQFGQNYGVSIYPYRPKNIITNPLIPPTNPKH